MRRAMSNDTPTAPAKALRGFALMDPERRRAIASRGGKGSAPQDRAFSRSRELAAAAGREGGRVTGQKRFDSMYLSGPVEEPG